MKSPVSLMRKYGLTKELVNEDAVKGLDFPIPEKVYAPDEIAKKLSKDWIKLEWIYTLIHSKLSEALIKSEFFDYYFYITRNDDGIVEVDISVIYEKKYRSYVSYHHLVIKDDDVLQHKWEEKWL